MRNYGRFIQRMKAQKGFTLIEVMITVAIMALSLFGLLAANISMQYSSIDAHERSVAVQHANQVIEQMRNSALTSLAAAATAFPSGTVASSNYTSSANEVLTNEAVTVAYTDGPDAGTSATDDNPLDVTVTVNWQQRGVRNATEVIRTYIAKRS